MRILVGDDSSLNTKLLGIALRAALDGCDVRECESVQKMILHCSSQRFDVVVTDQDYGDAAPRGHDFVRELRQQRHWETPHDVPVVFCTSSPRSHDVTACGADAIWSKPFPDVPTIGSTLRRLMAARESGREKQNGKVCTNTTSPTSTSCTHSRFAKEFVV